MKRTAIRTAALTLAAAVTLISSCGRTIPAGTDAEIIDFLTDCGVSVSVGYDKKTVTIPDTFGDVYNGYNELQKQQGFDLYPYRSREAEVYTYDVVSVDGERMTNTEAHVMVCDGIVIGGDIASSAIDGGMAPLIHNS